MYLAKLPKAVSVHGDTKKKKSKCGRKKKKEKKNDQKMKEMYTSEMYRSKLRLIRAMMVTMVMMRAFRYGMSGRDRGTSIPDRFLFTIVSNGTAPLPFLAHRDVSRKERGFFYFEPMGGGETLCWSDPYVSFFL